MKNDIADIMNLLENSNYTDSSLSIIYYILIKKKLINLLQEILKDLKNYIVKIKI